MIGQSMTTATIANTASLDRMLGFAARVGCEPDQLQRFLEAGYVPQAKQLEFHAAARECDHPDGPVAVGYGGTRGQAKTHAVIEQVCLDDCQRYPGLKWLYLRKIQKSAGEQLEDLINKLLLYTPHDYQVSKGILKFPNGSRVVIGGFKDEKDVDKYIGIEYDGIVREDATTLTKAKADQIEGSLRTSRADGWRPRLYDTANPGGIGHAWFKKLFVDPWQRKAETIARFIHTTMGDNVFINPEYAAYLNRLTGWLRRAWRDGDFSIAAGQFFTPFDPVVHVIEPFKITAYDAIWWAGLDYGTIHWNIAYLLCQLGEDIYVVDEHAARRKLAKQNALSINDMLARNGKTPAHLWKFPAGHDVFAQRGTKQTIAEIYEENGLRLTPAKTDRINGAARVLELLGNPDPQGDEVYIAPHLFIFDRCQRLIECLPEMQHDPRRGEDVLKVDADPESGEGGDDPYDALRYGVMEMPGRKGLGRNPAVGYRG